MECVNTEFNKTIKECEDIKAGYLLYEPWINALNDNIAEGEFTPQLCNGSWLYVDFPFQSKRNNFGINIRIQLKIGQNGKPNATFCDPNATFCDSSHLITFPSKTKINKVNLRSKYPELIKYYDLIIEESVITDEMFFQEKTFFDVESLIKFLKIIKYSIKNENYALLKAYFDDERTERALREITEC